MRALLVPTDQAKPSEYVDVDHDHRAITARIGAEWIERVRTPAPGIAMLIDEEGLLTDRPINGRVSGVLYPGPIHGDVLLVGEVDTPEGLDYGDVPEIPSTSLISKLLRIQS